MNLHRLYEMAPTSPDSYGKEIGITDKSDSSYRNSLEQPTSGPIGDISKSAWANLNVPTRGIPDTGNGNLGCAAAVSIIFYRATGLPIVPGKKIVLGTGTLWSSLTSRPSEWKKISNWQTDWQVGDIILTARGRKAGHVGVIVDGGKIISNSSKGFAGDRSGQIEQNYGSVESWNSIAKRNPKRTACFRYIGKLRSTWGGPLYYKQGDSSTSSGDSWSNMLNKVKSDALSSTSVSPVTPTPKPVPAVEKKPIDQLNQTKFKIYDSKNKKVLIAKLESKKYIIIKNRYGTEIGEATLNSGKISIRYKVRDNIVNLDQSDSSDSVYKGIYRIFNRISSGTSPSIERKKITPEEEQADITSGDFKISHKYSGAKATNIQALINEMNRQGIKNPYTQVAILAVIGKESGFIPQNEIMNYSKERLPEIWGVFSKTGKRVAEGQGKYNWNDLAAQYEHQPEKLANFVYGGRGHNNRSGDGWKYRGRGFNQITFKSGYETYSSATGIDLVSNPDRLNDINVAAEVAVKFLINGIKSLRIDPASFTNQQDATYYATKANAGGREIRNDETYEKAKKVERNFLITA
jgi:predicted chitinase